MKRIFKPGLYVAIGIAVGVGATVAAKPLNQTQVMSSPRMTAIDAGIGGASRSVSAIFLRDSKSGGCWIVTYDGSGESRGIAVAPPSACQ